MAKMVIRAAKAELHTERGKVFVKIQLQLPYSFRKALLKTKP